MKATGRQRAGAREKREKRYSPSAPKATRKPAKPPDQPPPEADDHEPTAGPPGTPGLTGGRGSRRPGAAVPEAAAERAIAVAVPSAAKAPYASVRSARSPAGMGPGAAPGRGEPWGAAIVAA